MRLGVAALVAAGAIGTVAVQGASADTAPVDSVSSSTLPSDWASGRNWRFNASACGSESCVSVGYYEFNTSSWSHGLILPINDGVAGPAVAASLPANATGSPYQYESLADVSCWSSAACVAVGNYTDSGGVNQALIVPIDHGVPGAPVEVTLPQGGTGGELFGVSCSSSGSCVAVGAYNATDGSQNAMFVKISDGVPDSALTVAAPANTASLQGAELSDISCQSNGACVAVGDYEADASSDYDAWVMPIDNGSAGTAQTIQLPANADQNTGLQDAQVQSVSCPASGTCAAIGHYLDATGHEHDLVVPITNGAASHGVEAPPPNGANGTAVSFSGLSCQASGACLAVGSYGTTAGETRAVAIPISNGAPSPALMVSLPSNEDLSGQLAELNGVSCPQVGACIAAGDYWNLTGNSVPMTVWFDAGTVGNGVQTAAPSDESTANNAYAVLDTIACAMTSCGATGDYSNPTTDAPYVLSIQALLEVSSASLPAGALGTPYSQTLSATGAWGVYSWSVTSGSLPAGLRLNALTGVISGTPTAAGTSSFTLTATGTGLPVQTASQGYSVSIAAAPTTTTTTTTPTPTPAAVPVLKLLSSSATVTKNKAGLVLSCSAAPCNGSLKLQITRTVTVKRGKKKLHKHVTVTIGNGGFSLNAAQTRTVTVTLNAAGRRALAAGHRLNATVLDTMAGVKQTLGHVTLKSAPVKHKKKH